MTPPNEDDDPEIYDVIIVGAGPCGLATAARLREQHPSALFTDEEHARFSWISSRAAMKNKRRGREGTSNRTPSRHPGPSILVLDESGDRWMTKWKTLFHKLEISHLRSPMFFHPDPSDRDALLAFCHEMGRTDEMVEITGCVGKEISKHQRRKSRAKAGGPCAKPATEINERDRRDYFTPSSACFSDFCTACINRYGLAGGSIRQEVVQEVVFKVPQPCHGAEPLFHIRTPARRYLARTVVLAVGAGEPIIPPPFPSKLPTSASHVSDASITALLDERLLARVRSQQTTAVLVVGGGLTAAQTADACIRNGIDKVWMLMRGHWKVKQFDVDLSWMSKFRNHQRATFWNADGFKERLSLIKEARGGGSMTSAASKQLKQHIRDGRLVIHTRTTIESSILDTTSTSWTVTTNPPIVNLPTFEHIFFATGTKTDINTLGMLQSHLANHPIETVGGLPILTTNLAWSDNIPLFINGKMAMLQLGPGAGNLEGAREGAERISWAVQNLLQYGPYEARGDDYTDSYADGYAMSTGNKFARLSCHM